MKTILFTMLLLATLQSNGQTFFVGKDTKDYKLVNCRDTAIPRFEKGKDPLNGMAIDAGWHPGDGRNYYANYYLTICDTIWNKKAQTIEQQKNYKNVIRLDVYDNGNIVKYVDNGKIKTDTVYHGVNIKEAKEVNIHGGKSLRKPTIKP